MATVLVRSGISVDPDELVSSVYVPGRQGSLQPELLAASRRYGRIPYVIAPDFSALLAEVENGRPVLVLQNLGMRLVPAWHYAVVVGFSREESEVFLRSGTDKRRVTDAGVFLNTWNRSDNWGVVLLRPGELPAGADPRRFIKAAAAAESAGQLELAVAAYSAAVERWPESAMAVFGLGNTAYRRGDLEEAERWYRTALALEPHHALTLNNLATVVAELGRCEESAELILAALDLPGIDASTAARLAATEAEVASCERQYGVGNKR